MTDWIDVKERLPYEGQKVEIKGKFPFIIPCEFHLTEAGGYEFYRHRERGIMSFYGVTHWKPDVEFEENK